ncbi:unnamed protein product [Meganyctiphanes norvegica]|uniref:Uncharacterized protein n=1 Tax=Meganyctiphanes norvegica TaxID=48144 RepID=A0AAV2SCD7_MEGNR
MLLLCRASPTPRQLPSGSSPTTSVRPRRLCSHNRGGPGGFGTGANNMPLGNYALSGFLRSLGNFTGGSGGTNVLTGRLNNSGDLQAREGTTTHEICVKNAVDIFRRFPLLFIIMSVSRSSFPCM